MRICLLIPSFYPATIFGGPIFSSYYTALNLSKSKNLHIYVSTTNTNMTKKLNVEVDKFIKVNSKFKIKYYNENINQILSISFLLHIWKDVWQSDIVHIQSIFNYTTPIGLFWAWVFRKKTILSPRGVLGDWALSKGNKFKKLWLNLLIRPFSNFVVWHATSQQEKEELVKHFPKARIEIIPNGVDFKSFSKPNYYNKLDYLKIFTNHNYREINKIIISLGRLQEKKGFDILIKSFKKVLIKYPKSVLLIAGPDGGEKLVLKKLISELCLSQNIFLIGEVKGQLKIDFLGNADVFALASHNENYGNVYIESLASGTPIVATFKTPWSNIEQLHCGKWVNNTVEDISSAIIDLLKVDKDKYRKNCRNFARQNDWKQVAEKFKSLFNYL